MIEVWKAWPRDGRYLVSSLGNIQDTRGKISSGYLYKTGYRGFAIGYAHRVVCETFLGPIPPKMTVNHINGDKGDNRLSNLEVVSQGENARHSYRTLGRRRAGIANPEAASKNRGETHNRAKLTEDDVREIRRLLAAGVARKDIAQRFGVTAPHIGHIKFGRLWAHIS